MRIVHIIFGEHKLGGPEQVPRLPSPCTDCTYNILRSVLFMKTYCI